MTHTTIIRNQLCIMFAVMFGNAPATLADTLLIENVTLVDGTGATQDSATADRAGMSNGTQIGKLRKTSMSRNSWTDGSNVNQLSSDNAIASG